MRFASIMTSLFTAVANAEAPNVLLVLIDDLRPVMKSFGGPVAAPHLDRLAQRGIRFVNNYANVPVCGASRASMLSGIAPSSTRFLSYDSRLDVDAPEAESLPAYFRRHGWHTAGAGKIFDVIEDSSDGWTEEVWNPEMRWHSPIPQDGRGEHLQKGYIEALSGGRPPAFERLDVDDTAYPDGAIAARAAKDLARLSNMKQPFFLAVGFRKPHLPFNAPARYWRDDESLVRPLPVTWYRIGEELPDLARHRSLELRMQYDALPLLGRTDDATASHLVRAYHAASRYIDAQVGHLIAALEATGTAGNTVVVVTGDHGFFLGEQRMWTKHALFETALRTPLIVVDPRRVGGQAARAVTDLLDVYPTLADLAGLKVPQTLDGVSLTPLLDDPSLRVLPSKPVSVSRWMNGESVRDQRYRYTVWYDENGREIDRMLFDLAADSDETRNLAADEAYKNVIAELSAQLADRRVGSAWSPKLTPFVERLDFANSRTGALVVAITTAPIIAFYGSLPLVALIVGWLVYRRRRQG